MNLNIEKMDDIDRNFMKLECLWCFRKEEDVSFKNEAHTIPQSLGGRFICENVCDECNHYFGKPHNNKPAVEVVLKEAFEITRFIVFTNNQKRNNNYSRLKSTFFRIDNKDRKLSFKKNYSSRLGFQSTMARQFKRGLFKVFLEEYQRQTGKGMDSQFDFIREFARYDLNDIPVYYLQSRLPVLPIVDSEFISPKLNFNENLLKRIESYGLYHLNICGHGFLMPTNRLWHINLDNNIREEQNHHNEKYYDLIPINSFNDIDFMLNFLWSN